MLTPTQMDLCFHEVGAWEEPGVCLLQYFESVTVMYI